MRLGTEQGWSETKIKIFDPAQTERSWIREAWLASASRSPESESNQCGFDYKCNLTTEDTLNCRDQKDLCYSLLEIKFPSFGIKGCKNLD